MAATYYGLIRTETDGDLLVVPNDTRSAVSAALGVQQQLHKRLWADNDDVVFAQVVPSEHGVVRYGNGHVGTPIERGVYELIENSSGHNDEVEPSEVEEITYRTSFDRLPVEFFADDSFFRCSSGRSNWDYAQELMAA